MIGQFNSDDKFVEIQKELLFRLPNISRNRERKGVHICNSKVSVFLFYKLKRFIHTKTYTLLRGPAIRIY